MTTFQEYVDDSEPERQESRRRRKAVKKKKSDKEGTTLATRRSETAAPFPQPAGFQSSSPSPSPLSSESIIELSDATEDERPVIEAMEFPLSGPSVRDLAIGMSDNTPRPASKPSHQGPLSPPAIHIASSSPIRASSPTRVSSPMRVSSPIRNGLFSDPLDPAPGLRLKLGEFVYAQDAPPPKFPRAVSALSLASSSSSAETEPPAPVKRIRKTKPRLVPDIPDADLATLRKCPSCSIAWTIRKTVPNKLTHIQTCARKHGLTQETLTGLVREELAKAPPPSAKGKDKAPEADAPKTYLEDVVDVAGPKKKHRRPQVQSTVKGLSQTRDTILERARSLLGNQQQDPVSTVEPTQAFGPSKLAAPVMVFPPEPMLTQAFGHSDLAKRLAFLRSGEPSSGESSAREDDDDAPPATQAFAPSKLALRRGRTSHISISTSSSDDDIHLSISSSSGLSPPRPSTSLTGYPRPPRSPLYRPLSLRRSPAPEGPEQEWPGDDDRQHVDGGIDVDPFAWVNDDVYLHFDPAIEPEPNWPDMPLDDADIAREDRRPQPVSTRNPVQEVRPLPEPSGTKPKSKRKTKQRLLDNDDEVDDDAGVQKLDDPTLYAKMKELILQDKALHLRILRYEPVNFSEFMKLADVLNVSSRGLKLRVRAFLDEQAINFFGAEPGGSRTRR